MALLKYIGGEPKELSGFGVFHFMEIKTVPDDVAKKIVCAQPEKWTIEVPAEQVEARKKSYAENRRLDTKKRR